MKFGVYKRSNYTRPIAVRRNGGPVLFGSKKEAKTWLAENEAKLVSTHLPGTEFFVGRRIKRTDGTVT